MVFIGDMLLGYGVPDASLSGQERRLSGKLTKCLKPVACFANAFTLPENLGGQADQKIYDFMHERIPEKIRNMEVLEIATDPGLLAKHVAPAAKRMIATDYSDGMIAEAKRGDCPTNLTFEVADAMTVNKNNVIKYTMKKSSK